MLQCVGNMRKFCAVHFPPFIYSERRVEEIYLQYSGLNIYLATGHSRHLQFPFRKKYFE